MTEPHPVQVKAIPDIVSDDEADIPDQSKSTSANPVHITGYTGSQTTNPSSVKKTLAAASVKSSAAITTAAPVPVPTPVPNASATVNSCVITLFGQQFDVARLRSTHPGGNIFVCGTDMTASYQSKHGTSLSRMQAYAVGNSNTTNTGNSTGTSGSGSTYNFEDDDEEDEHELERYYENQQKQLEAEREDAKKSQENHEDQ